MLGEALPSPDLQTSVVEAGDVSFGATPLARKGESASKSFLESSSFNLEVTRPATYAYQPLQMQQPGRSAFDSMTAVDNLMVDFVSSSCSGHAEDEGGDKWLDQVAEYEELVNEHVSRLRGQVRAGAGGRRPQEEQAATVLADQLAKERNTWRLVGKLFAMRAQMRNGQTSMEEDQAMVSASPFRSEQTIIASLFEHDERLRRAQTVVDWLEQNAADEMQEELAGAAYGDALLGWENTHQTLQLGSDVSATASMVSELDPDAKTRQRRPLHDYDEKDERRLIRLVYLCQRAGMLDRAKELCVSMGQPWRAATLVGWELSDDPNLGSSDEEKLPATGNTRRDLWKRMAWQLSNNNTVSAQERAIYSSLCGNAKQLLASGMCSSWEDRLWAYTKAMVDTLVEDELRKTMPKTFVPMPQQYWDNVTSMDDIFEGASVGSTSSSCPYQKLQTHVVLEDWTALLSSALAVTEDEEDPQLLRFTAHLVMCLENMAQFNDEDGVRDKVSKRKFQLKGSI